MEKVITSRWIVNTVGLLFTILFDKSKGMCLITSSGPYMYLFQILLYSVLCLVIVIELL